MKWFATESSRAQEETTKRREATETCASLVPAYEIKFKQISPDRYYETLCPVTCSRASVANSTSSRDESPLTPTAPATRPSFQMGMPPPQPTNLGSPK